jgi:adenylate cyclase class IV
VDTYFQTVDGSRLKIRSETNIGSKEPTKFYLINYSRPDEKNPKLSKYLKIELYDESDELIEILCKTLTNIGIVKKTRDLIIIKSHLGDVRVHFDHVKGVEDREHFIELEIPVNGTEEQEGFDKKVQDAKSFAQYLLKEFQIPEKNLITGSYIDMLHVV